MESTESFSKHEMTPEVNTHLIPTAIQHLPSTNDIKPVIEKSPAKETLERNGTETTFKLQWCKQQSSF